MPPKQKSTIKNGIKIKAEMWLVVDEMKVLPTEKP